MAKKLDLELFVNRQFWFCRVQFQNKHAWKFWAKSSGLLGKMTGSCVWWGMKLNITVFWLHYSLQTDLSLCFCLSRQHQSCRITRLRMYKLRASHLFLELHWPSALQCHHIHISIYSSLLRTLLLWINYDEATLCCVVLIFFSIFGYVYKTSHHVSTISVQKHAIWDKHGASTTFQPKEILLPVFYKNDTGVSIYSF